MSKRREFRPLLGMDALEDRVVMTQGVASHAVNAAINVLPSTTYNQNVAYVRALDAFIGRNETAATIQNEALQLTNGRVTRLQLARGAVHTPQAAAAETTGLFHLFLGRNPLPSELAFYNNNGHPRSVAVQTAQVLGSDEYFAAAGGTNQKFITAVYSDFLGRTPDAGAQSWVTALNQGASRQDVAARIVNSPEGASNQVYFAYTRTLNRVPDAGAQVFANSIARGSSVEHVLVSLLASQEYYDKAQVALLN